MSAGQIDDAQAQVAQRCMLIQVESMIIGPAMPNTLAHAPEHAFTARARCRENKTGNPTHTFLV